MRKIINSTYISLDGVIEAPHAWPPTEASDPAADRIQTDLLLSCDEDGAARDDPGFPRTGYPELPMSKRVGFPRAALERSTGGT